MIDSYKRLSFRDKNILNDLFNSGGYVFDFTNKNFSEFIYDICGLNIYRRNYSKEATGKHLSKMKLLIEFVDNENIDIVVKVLNSLWEYQDNPNKNNHDKKNLFNDFIKILEEKNKDKIDYGILDNYKDITIEEYLTDIKGHIDRKEVNLVMTSLHSVLTTIFRQILDKKKIEYIKDESIDKLMSKYAKSLDDNIYKFTKPFLKALLNIYNTFNDIRNNHSLAHPTEKFIEIKDSTFVVKSILLSLEYITEIEKNSDIKLTIHDKDYTLYK